MKQSLVKIIIRFVFYPFLAIIFLMIGYVHIHQYFRIGQDRIPIALKDMKILSHALRSYAAQNTFFPYDSRGSQYALYKIKPFIIEFPNSLPRECWDDENTMLCNLPYDYLNGSNIELYADSCNPSNNIIITAERIKPDAKGINLITQNGDVLWYQPQDIILKDIGKVVGKYLIELKSPNWTSSNPRKRSRGP